LLLIVDLISKLESFPVDSLKEVDSALATLGFKKEVHSVVRPGKHFSVTYDGPLTEKSEIEKILLQVSEKNQINFSVQTEESVKFP
jgi:hypothetical protein